jgi:hypothetical protein
VEPLWIKYVHVVIIYFVNCEQAFFIEAVIDDAITQTFNLFNSDSPFQVLKLIKQ